MINFGTGIGKQIGCPQLVKANGTIILLAGLLKMIILAARYGYCLLWLIGFSIKHNVWEIRCCWFGKNAFEGLASQAIAHVSFSFFRFAFALVAVLVVPST